MRMSMGEIASPCTASQPKHDVLGEVYDIQYAIVPPVLPPWEVLGSGEVRHTSHHPCTSECMPSRPSCLKKVQSLCSESDKGGVGLRASFACERDVRKGGGQAPG